MIYCQAEHPVSLREFYLDKDLKFEEYYDDEIQLDLERENQLDLRLKMLNISFDSLSSL